MRWLALHQIASARAGGGLVVISPLKLGLHWLHGIILTSLVLVVMKTIKPAGLPGR